MVREKALSSQILKLEIICRLLGVSFFFFLATDLHAQTACSGCYKIKRPVCEKRCKGAATRFAFSSCADSCVSTSCSKFCNIPNPQKVEEESPEPNLPLSNSYSELGDSFHNLKGVCGKCLRRASSTVCASRCSVDEVENSAACRNSCAKLECSSSCQLPNEDAAVADEKRPTARDCGECKRFSEIACNAGCENLKDQPGYTTCVVSCVEDKCYQKCNPE